MQEFEKFADERLNNHLEELSTRYENQEIGKETLEKAYSEHKEIFRQELEEKLNELAQNDQGLHAALQNQKHLFLIKLNFNQSKN